MEGTSIYSSEKQFSKLVWFNFFTTEQKQTIVSGKQ